MAEDKPKNPLSEDEFTRFGQALMQVSKEELAEVAATEERKKADLPHEKRRGRPKNPA